MGEKLPGAKGFCSFATLSRRQKSTMWQICHSKIPWFSISIRYQRLKAIKITKCWNIHIFFLDNIISHISYIISYYPNQEMVLNWSIHHLKANHRLCMGLGFRTPGLEERRCSWPHPAWHQGSGSCWMLVASSVAPSRSFLSILMLRRFQKCLVLVSLFFVI